MCIIVLLVCTPVVLHLEYRVKLGNKFKDTDFQGQKILAPTISTYVILASPIKSSIIPSEMGKIPTFQVGIKNRDSIYKSKTMYELQQLQKIIYHYHSKDRIIKASIMFVNISMRCEFIRSAFIITLQHAINCMC